MSGFSFGNAVIGLAQGQQQAQQLQAKRLQNEQMQQQLQEQKRQLDAAAAVLHGIGAGPTPQLQSVPMPGATPMPGAAPPMAGPPGMPAASGGVQALPVGGGGGASAPRAPPSMGGAPGGGVSGPAPQPGPAAPAPVLAAMQGGDPVSGVARPTGDFVQDSKNTFMSIASDIKRRNPGIDDATLLAATQQQIGVMRGLEPETRAYLDTQVKYAQLQERTDRDQKNYETRIAKLDNELQIANAKIASLEKIAQGHDKKDVTVAGTRAGATLGAASTRADATVKAAGIGADSRRDVANTGAGAKRDVAGANNASAERRAQVGADARVQAARVAAGQNPTGAGGPPRKRYNKGDLIKQGDKTYRVTGGDPYDPDVVEVKK